jgi:glycosyltransferase involved in cell wall biosynthesis
MLEAARTMKQVQFICIGGRDFEVDHYVGLVHASGLNNVQFLGYVPNSKLPNYLSSADILIAPYTRECQAIDGMRTIEYASPLKLFEYMAAGKPIITSNVGAIPEVIEHERNGLLVNPGSVREFIAAVDRLLTDQNLAQRLGRAAREDSFAYSWEARCSRILTFAGVG